MRIYIYIYIKYNVLKKKYIYILFSLYIYIYIYSLNNLLKKNYIFNFYSLHIYIYIYNFYTFNKVIPMSNNNNNKYNVDSFKDNQIEYKDLLSEEFNINDNTDNSIITNNLDS